MTFNGEQLSAIYKVAYAMVVADGRVDDNEVMILQGELLRFGVSEEQAATMMNAAKHMEPQKAMEIISKFGQQEKRYVAALLGTIMVADNDLNERELKLWQLTSALCGLPAMTINEAATFMRDQYAQYAPAPQHTSASSSSSGCMVALLLMPVFALKALSYTF